MRIAKLARYIIVSIIFIFTFAQGSQANELTIMTEEFRPFGYKENGKIKGMAVDVVREILRIVKHRENIVILPWARAYLNIQNEPKHILFAMGRSPARENLFKWVGPIFSNRTFFYKKRDSNIHIETMEDAKKVKAIGVVINDFNHTLLKSKGFKNLRPNTNHMSNIKMLILNRLDLVPSGELGIEISMHEAKIESKMIERTKVLVFDSKLYIALSKDIPDSVVQQWQEALEQVIRDGIHAKIRKKYIKKK
jgi:polar amino acid transport system substrate-binding protein